MRAIVRRPGPRLADCELTYLERVPIDVDRARHQHAAYVDLLHRLGAEIVWLAPADEHPDGVFVEDTAVVAPPLAVLTRPGTESRRGEVRTMRPALDRDRRPVVELTPPARLDGGDVLLVGHTLYVGVTARTDDEGRRQLADSVRPHGFQVTPVGVSGVLHLKTALTALPDGTLLTFGGHVDRAALGRATVIDAAEPSGANVLTLGDAVVIAASAPRTAEAVADLGWAVHVVEIDEFEKAEAGVTCLSVLYPRPAPP
ncbi:MAG: dimethylarginine dimethylaminohydrolase family protein [Acidimicrobiales bacterium]